MIFLKRLEAYGFKSFAKPTKIIFDKGMIGVVGPNGSGKSNINDAIRWVLGEQSIKSLRGENSQDIIFQGSHDHPQLNMAEVTLVFNNFQKFFPLEFDEIEISRRIYRDNNENEYYINKTKVRLKDVQELVLGTGLTKSSLAIINQGNVSSFAEVKPQERRLLFEEVANVSKYKKRKLEALRKLEKTQDNLLRINDIINELEKSIQFLEKQANKAKKFLEKQKELTTIEVTMLVNDIKKQNEELEQITLNLKNQQIKNENLNFEIVNKENKTHSLQEKIISLDNTIQDIINDLEKCNNELEDLQNQKIFKLHSGETQIDKVKILEIENETLTEEIYQYNDLIQEQKKSIDDLKKQRFYWNEDLEISMKKYNMLNKEIYELKTKCSHLIDLQSNKRHYYQGVQTILNNKSNLSGVIDTVNQLIKVPEKYQLAIQEALSNSVQNIVVENDSDALRAIKFLKNNKAGVATFLPLNTLKGQKINSDDLMLINLQEGFIGLASELITFNSKFTNVINFLLGRIIIANSLKEANDIAHLTYRKYQIITLQGDILRVGGSISGGYKKTNNLFFNNSEEIEKLELKINELEEMSKSYYKKWQNIKDNLVSLNNDLEQKQLYLGKIQQKQQDNEQRQKDVIQEYERLTNKQLNNISQNVDELMISLDNKINHLKLKKSQFNEQLQNQRNLRSNYSNELHQLIQETKMLRQEYNLEDQKNNKYQFDILKLKNLLQQNLERLGQEYHLTYEYGYEKYSKNVIKDEESARKQILNLRQEIKTIGPVNLDVIEEYNSVNERYKFLKEQQQELVSGQNQLTIAIKEMDAIMCERFDSAIKDINKVLPETFQVLFNGGDARLIYSEPNNILESGIEILVNLPGKTITNLNLLSGGEKSLVALSVLFAILKARPLPLVILDEVEAPLDVANVERFARYLKTFSKQTQFIIITHRPGTMENCDILYGTTMQIKGVTKMVSIKLEQVKKIVPESNNEKSNNNLTI